MVYLNADKVESCHGGEELVVVEPTGQINVEILEHLKQANASRT